jgi:hypothetical protein
MYPNFQVASRTPDKHAEAKAELDAMFECVKGKAGKLNPRGQKELHDNRFEIGALVTQLISDEVALTDPTPLFCETTEGTFGDEYLWQEPNSALRVVSRSYGSKPLSQRITFKEFAMSTNHKEVNVEIPLEQIAVGRVTASMVVEQMADALVRDRISLVLTAIDAGVPSGADQTGVSGYTLRYSGLTDPNLTKAINGLLDESEGVTVYGRHITLAPAIQGFTGFSDFTKQELERRGMIGSFRGANIVTLQDKYSRRAAGHAIPTNRVWLAGQSKGAILMTKDVSFLNYSVVDERTATFMSGIRIEDGVMVWRPYNYRIIEV